METLKKRPGRPVVNGLTDAQKRTLRIIQNAISLNGRSPSVQEIGAETQNTAATAQEHVDQLVKKGFLSRESGKNRSLRILKDPNAPVSDLVEIPIVGTVVAGYPILTEQHVIGQVTIERSLARCGRCFALRVAGESMIGADIRNGDLVIVRQQQLAENGDIVVAMLNGETTVKRLSFREDLIELKPENRKFKAIQVTPDCDFRLLGKVVGVRRVSKF